MKFKYYLILPLSLLFLLQGCKYYNFTGGSTGDAKTFQVNFFQNNAPLVEPNLDRDFTIALQDLINNQTNLQMVTSNGDLVYEGEITDYYISPMTATAQQTAAQNRLTIRIRVRFTNNTAEGKDFEQTFSHFYDYGATEQLRSVQTAAFKEIFERITQDIFNASLSNW